MAQLTSGGVGSVHKAEEVPDHIPNMILLLNQTQTANESLEPQV